jgi:hypothetical protein
MGPGGGRRGLIRGVWGFEVMPWVVRTRGVAKSGKKVEHGPLLVYLGRVVCEQQLWGLR